MNKGRKTSFCQRHADGRERKRGPEAFLSGRIEMRSVVPLVHRQGTSARLGGNVHSFVSTASTAASFRSKCGSTRRPPECSSQRCPLAAPQLGQGTDDSCFGVRCG